MNENLKCPVIKADRLEVLLMNTLTFLSTEILPHLLPEEEIELLKDEIGITDEEIETLDIMNKIFGIKEDNND